MHLHTSGLPCAHEYSTQCVPMPHMMWSLTTPHVLDLHKPLGSELRAHDTGGRVEQGDEHKTRLPYVLLCKCTEQQRTSAQTQAIAIQQCVGRTTTHVPTIGLVDPPAALYASTPRTNWPPVGDD